MNVSESLVSVVATDGAGIAQAFSRYCGKVVIVMKRLTFVFMVVVFSYVLLMWMWLDEWKLFVTSLVIPSVLWVVFLFVNREETHDRS
jgi:hypothetical protein